MLGDARNLIKRSLDLDDFTLATRRLFEVGRLHLGIAQIDKHVGADRPRDTLQRSDAGLFLELLERRRHRVGTPARFDLLQRCGRFDDERRSALGSHDVYIGVTVRDHSELGL